MTRNLHCILHKNVFQSNRLLVITHKSVRHRGQNGRRERFLMLSMTFMIRGVQLPESVEGLAV